MTNANDLGAAIGRTAYDDDGDKIGAVGQVYLNDETGQPEWVTIKTGLFGTKQSFAPLYGSTLDGDDLRLAVSKQLVKDAPSVEDDGHLSAEESDELFAHYRHHLGAPSATMNDGNRYDLDNDSTADTSAGVADDAAYDTRQTPGGGDGAADPSAGPLGHDTSGPTTDTAMTRSEERLRVGTETVETGRARLRKYIVEENVSTTVPVSHEEVRVEREPITDATMADAVDGPELSEEEHEVTLHAERPVVAKETVPVERVKLTTDTVTDQAQIDETIRKEQIEQIGGEQRGTTSPNSDC